MSLVLFIYATTEGNYEGWASGGVLAPLVVSIALMAAFGFIEMKVAEPLIPPKVWTLPAFLPLFLITMRYVASFRRVIALALIGDIQRISMHERHHLPGIGGLPAGVGHVATWCCDPSVRSLPVFLYPKLI